MTASQCHCENLSRVISRLLTFAVLSFIFLSLLRTFHEKPVLTQLHAVTT